MKTGAGGVVAGAGLVALLVIACGSDTSSPVDPGGGGGGEDAGDATTTPGDGSSGGPDGSPSSDAARDTNAPPSDAPPGDSPSGVVPDPNVDGPFAIAEKDATTTIAATSDTVAIHAAYPTAPGSYPVVVVGHGFNLPVTQYYGYVKRLATFGYVAMTVDYPGSIASGTNNPNEAKDMLGGIDWAKADPTIGPVTDATTAGMTGHSLGGKVALLAATMDPRVKASIVLDPVDGGGPGGCTAPSCVIVADLVPGLKIPTGILGETTDASGGLQPCAPAAFNFTTFYAKTIAPSLEVTLAGANHMSFLDDEASCGLVCTFCNAATAPNAQVNGLAKAYVVAFYERWLRSKTGYDTYLTGAQAQARYVATGQATIVSK